MFVYSHNNNNNTNRLCNNTNNSALFSPAIPLCWSFRSPFRTRVYESSPEVIGNIGKCCSQIQLHPGGKYAADRKVV